MPKFLTERDLGRMFDWLVWALCFHIAAMVLRHLGWEPQIQTVMWKLGNLTLAAFAGYWIDRRVFHLHRIGRSAPALEQIRRAIVVAAAMVAVGLGL